jgi:hypothetical protein
VGVEITTDTANSDGSHDIAGVVDGTPQQAHIAAEDYAVYLEVAAGSLYDAAPADLDPGELREVSYDAADRLLGRRAYLAVMEQQAITEADARAAALDELAARGESQAEQGLDPSGGAAP